MSKIRVADIVDDSIVDGPGIRLVVFTQGCNHHCVGCHNPSTHAITGGYEKDIDEIIGMARANPLLSGISLSGGEPFLQVEACLEMVNKIQDMGLDVIVYTGFVFEELLEEAAYKKDLAEFLRKIDYLVDGRFELDKRNIGLRFRGSDNQRIIDVRKSLQDHDVILVDWDE